MICIIDYGLGNIQAFLNIYKKYNIPAIVSRDIDDISKADKLILPGVGHFDHAMQAFRRSSFYDSIQHRVLGENVPILGICVGMQMLANMSDEGNEKGLGWIDGGVKVFDRDLLENLPLPHMGWNDVVPDGSSPIFKGFTEHDCKFYFLHSYYFDCTNNPSHSIAVSHYGSNFCCAVNKKNIFGVQFHPEKSHHYGEKLLLNFAEHV